MEINLFTKNGGVDKINQSEADKLKAKGDGFDGEILQFFDPDKKDKTANPDLVAKEFLDAAGKIDTKKFDTSEQSKKFRSEIGSKATAKNYLKSQFYSMAARDWGERVDSRELNNAARAYDKDAKSFNGAIQYCNGAPELKAEDKLTPQQVSEFLKSDGAKKLTEELGIAPSKIEVKDGKATVTVEGKTYNVDVDKTNGTLRFSSTDPKSDNVLDLKLTKDAANAAKEAGKKPDAIEMETAVSSYHIGANEPINIQAKMGDKVDISTDGIKSFENANPKALEELKAITGENFDKLEAYGNQEHYTDKDGKEHQFYYDKKNNRWIEAVRTNDTKKGGYNVELRTPKTNGTGWSGEFPKAADGKLGVPIDDKGNLRLQEAIDKAGDDTDFKGQKFQQGKMEDIAKKPDVKKALEEAGFKEGQYTTDGNSAVIKKPDGTVQKAFVTENGKVAVVEIKNGKATLLNAKAKNTNGTSSFEPNQVLGRKGKIDSDGNYVSKGVICRQGKVDLKLTQDEQKAYAQLEGKLFASNKTEGKVVGLSDQHLANLKNCKTQKEFYSYAKNSLGLSEAVIKSGNNPELKKFLDALPEK